MPIRAEMRDKYPADWSEISWRVRDFAGHKCEACGVRNHAWGWRDENGKFHETPRESLPRDYGRPPFWFGTMRIIEIVLTVAHLNHDPANCELSNLKAWCQKCHLSYDAKRHASNAAATRRARMLTIELPLEP